MAFAAFLAGLAAVMLLAPDTPAARWLHRHCVEELLDLAGRLERKHILFLVVGLVSIQAFAMTLPAELAVAMAWDVTAYVDLVIAGWTLSAFARVSIDDFGTRYSSLNYLRRFPVTSIKIDQSFVRDLNLHHHNSAAIIHAISSIAYSFGLRILAAGVDTEAQRHLLS